MPTKSRYNADFTGEVNYGHKVVMSIINFAALEIRGVAGLQGRGVRTELADGKINVDVYIDVMYGFSCVEVAYRVQENIKRSVESMTTLKTGTINVNVLGVSFEESK